MNFLNSLEIVWNLFSEFVTIAHFQHFLKENFNLVLEINNIILFMNLVFFFIFSVGVKLKLRNLIIN